jgi:hypothetical protein
LNAGFYFKAAMGNSPSDDEAFEEARPRPRPPRRDDEEGVHPQARRPPPPVPEEEDRPRRRPRPPDYEDRQRRPFQGDDDAISSLIPYKNGQALAAYYVGVFSLIPCVGFALAILGILGLNFAKNNPTAKGAGHAIAGIVLGGFVLVCHLVALVIFVAGIASSRK